MAGGYLKREFVFCWKLTPRLKADPLEWPLIMLGDGPLHEEVLHMIQDQGILGVQLPGFVSESERHTTPRKLNG